MFHHPFAEDLHALLVGGGLKDFVRRKVRGLNTDCFPGTWRILNENEVSEERRGTLSEECCALGFAKLISAGNGFFTEPIDPRSWAAKRFQFYRCQQPILKDYDHIPRVCLLESPRQKVFFAKHFASLGTILTGHLNDHVAEAIKMPGSIVPPILMSCLPVFTRRALPSSPEGPDRLVKAFLIVENFGDHGCYPLKTSCIPVANSYSECGGGFETKCGKSAE